MKKYYPKKINFTFAAFTVCFMLLVLAPNTSSLSAEKVEGLSVSIDGGPSTTNSYLVWNGIGTTVVRAYFPAGTFAVAGQSKVDAFVSFKGGVELYNANLLVFSDGSALLVGVNASS